MKDDAAPIPAADPESTKGLREMLNAIADSVDFLAGQVIIASVMIMTADPDSLRAGLRDAGGSGPTGLAIFNLLDKAQRLGLAASRLANHTQKRADELFPPPVGPRWN
jgi:hypothetical protein